MKLGIGAVPFGPKVSINLDLIRRAEELGFDSAWTAEAYGNDAVSTAAWVLAKTTRIKVGTAIMQMPARTPAMAAMTAMTLDHLSGGRFILGLGPSGPQVVEGWHGVPYGKPLTRTREYIQIIRQILAREKPLVFHGSEYEIPASGPGTTGLGKPLKSILHGNPKLPIYTASISPNGLRCAAEVADGVFPMMLDPEKFDVAYLPHLEEGFAAAGNGKGLADFAVVPGVSVIVTDEPREGADGREERDGALHRRHGRARQELLQRPRQATRLRRSRRAHPGSLPRRAEGGGRRARFPTNCSTRCISSGPAARIRDRLAAWKEAGRKGWVDTMQVATSQPAALELLAEELL